MDTPKAIIFSAIIIAIAIIVQSGIYEFSSVGMGAVQRYNKLTGDVSLCLLAEGCESFFEGETAISSEETTVNPFLRNSK